MDTRDRGLELDTPPAVLRAALFFCLCPVGTQRRMPLRLSNEWQRTRLWLFSEDFISTTTAIMRVLMTPPLSVSPFQWWNLSTLTICGTDQIDKTVCKLAVAVAACRPALPPSDSDYAQSAPAPSIITWSEKLNWWVGGGRCGRLHCVDGTSETVWWTSTRAEWKVLTSGGWKQEDETFREVHDVVFFRQAASRVSWQDSRDEKGDFKGRLKQTSLPVWLVEMGDAQDFAKHLCETQQLKEKGTICFSVHFQAVFVSIF